MCHMKPRERASLTSYLYTSFMILAFVTTISSLPACSSKPIVNQAVPSPEPIRSSTKSPLPKDLAARWLKEIPCRPPCWEGVTPGITSADAAASIWARNPLFGSVKTAVSKLTTDYGELDWTWADGSDGGRATFHAQAITQPVSAISPAFPTPISLHEVIQAYGEPSYVVATAYHGPDFGSGIFYSLSIIYESLGIRLHIGDAFKPVLSEEMLFSDVLFYDPSDEKFIKPQELLVPWQGIRDFSYYCRDQEGGQACRGSP